ncbi:uncharacterized protein BDZ99DRAFT_38037 [Mytilinidion resinicola]|uniref:Uncharacterized protein n=1 Tax=Mytilinidion resinicola TaxID=574789 RepID=A0A6A6YJJ8_9PEZI|nr:uncharacterized protein BDZ99DRAFT_38037 [Mytilinidion resinicola]KAF2808703.1 hypothetical protein BDZ99DRAFT_38037 [Mytilinidion resinicola]
MCTSIIPTSSPSGRGAFSFVDTAVCVNYVAQGWIGMEPNSICKGSGHRRSWLVFEFSVCGLK